MNADKEMGILDALMKNVEFANSLMGGAPTVARCCIERDDKHKLTPYADNDEMKRILEFFQSNAIYASSRHKFYGGLHIAVADRSIISFGLTHEQRDSRIPEQYRNRLDVFTEYVPSRNEAIIPSILLVEAAPKACA